MYLFPSSVKHLLLLKIRLKIHTLNNKVSNKLATYNNTNKKLSSFTFLVLNKYKSEATYLLSPSKRPCPNVLPSPMPSNHGRPRPACHLHPFPSSRLLCPCRHHEISLHSLHQLLHQARPPRPSLHHLTLGPSSFIPASSSLAPPLYFYLQPPLSLATTRTPSPSSSLESSVAYFAPCISQLLPLPSVLKAIASLHNSMINTQSIISL